MNLTYAAAFACLSPAAVAQFGPSQSAVLEPDLGGWVHAADFDGDGDPDLLAAILPPGVESYDRLVWYENLGGGVFGSERLIFFDAEGPRGLFADDLDGDGDQDVLLASTGPNEILWFANSGAGSFGPAISLTSNERGAWDVRTADIDGDGDRDVISTGIDGDTVSWYENLGGGAFAPRQVVGNYLQGAARVAAGDIDGDGDADVFAASSFDDKIVWYENLGQAGFGPEQLLIDYDFASAVTVQLADVDGDGDLDPVTANYYATRAWARIHWHENLGGGAFGSPHIITNEALQTRRVAIEDLDGDGDVDVLATHSYGASGASWYENLGGGQFSAQKTIALEFADPIDVKVADMDGDGQKDVVLLYPVGYESIAWHRSQFGSMDSYCQPSVVNASGSAGVMTAVGSVDAFDNDLVLRAGGLPASVSGYFLTSQNTGFVAQPGGSNGNLCLGGAIGRLSGPGQVMNSGLAGQISLQLDVSSIPTPTGFVAAASGQTWNFQCWFRDPAPVGPPGSNFTDAMSVTFR